MKLATLLSFLGFVLFLAGTGSFYYFPIRFASNVYFSENALSPHIAAVEYNQGAHALASHFASQYNSFQRTLKGGVFLGVNDTMENEKCEEWSRLTAEWLSNSLSKYHFRSSGTSSFTAFMAHRSVTGWSVHGVIRAPRADGTEGMLLSARFNPVASATSALALSVALASHLAQRQWLARDYVFVFTPECGGASGLDQWLRAFHSDDKRSSLSLPRSHLIAALNLELDATSAQSLTFTRLSIGVHGPSGQLPNLDLVSVTLSNARAMMVDFQARDRDFASHREPQGKDSGPEIDFGRPLWFLTKIPFLRQQRDLFSFMIRQALGVPDEHYGGAYHIDSLTLKAQTPRGDPTKKSFDLMHIVRLMESVIRCTNNIQEHLHQSFYYYLLPGPGRYIPIGHYMVPFGLMMAGFLLPAYVLLRLPFPLFLRLCGLSVAAHVAGGILYKAPLLFVGLDTLSPWPYLLPDFIIQIAFAYLLSSAFWSASPGANPMTLEHRVAIHAIACLGPILCCTVLSILNFSLAVFYLLFLVPLTYLTRPRQNRWANFFAGFLVRLLKPTNVMFAAIVITFLHRQGSDWIPVVPGFVLSTADWWISQITSLPFDSSLQLNHVHIYALLTLVHYPFTLISLVSLDTKIGLD